MSLALTHLTAGRDVKVDVAVNLAARTAATQFAGTIRSFFEEYLLTEDGNSTQPFGGRDTVLERLDTWFTNEVGAPRLLLVAPAGRGKSAVLVQWVRTLQEATPTCMLAEKEIWNIVFVPISIRFKLNQPTVFYQAIAARLAEILHSTSEAALTDPSTFYEDRCRQLLDQAVARQVPILMVIDGIDEALGGSFSVTWFPRRPGRYLRLVVSARFQVGDDDSSGWLRRLGWHANSTAETCDLEPLTFVDIEELLCKTLPSFKSHASRASLVAKLNHLTAGEPLVLALYLRDLLSKDPGGLGVDAEYLERVNPGLEGYFHDWLSREQQVWEHERANGAVIDESVLRACLSVLACAQGPLTAFEVDEVTKRLGINLSSLRVEDALRPLRRFIVGTGSARVGHSSGFVLGHPKFADFLKDEYFDRHQIVQVQQAFASWGAQIMTRLRVGELPPTVTPAYLVNFLGQHFEDAEASAATFMGLVDKSWIRACEHYNSSYQGAASDIKRALVAVSKPGIQSRAAQIRCKLFLSSIDSRFFNRNTQLVSLCIADGLLSAGQVLSMLAHSMSPSGTADIIKATVPYLPDAVIPQVIAYARMVSGIDKVIAVTAIAARATDEQRGALLSEATATATLIPSDDEYARAFLAIAEAESGQSRENAVEQALGRVDLFNTSFLREDDAILFASLLTEGRRRHLFAKMLWEVRAHFNATKGFQHDLSVRQAGILRIQAIFCRFLPAGDQSRIIARVCAYVKEARLSHIIGDYIGLLGPALTLDSCRDILCLLPDAIEDDRDVYALVAVARHLPVDERRPILKKALASEERLKDELAIVQLFARMADLFSESDRARVLLDGFALCRNISSLRARCVAFAELASKVQDSSSFVDEWLSSARCIQDEWRTRALCQVVPYLSEATREAVLSELALFIETNVNRHSRPAHRLIVARHLADNERQPIVDKARNEILSLERSFLRRGQYPELMRALEPEMQVALLPTVLEDLQETPAGRLRIAEMLQIAEHACETVHSTFIRAALHECDNVPAKERALDIASVARLAPSQMRHSLAIRALEEARCAGNPHLVAECMSMLAPVMALSGDVTYVDNFLRTEGQISRRSLVFWLSNFLPVVARFEGVGALREIHRALLDVSDCFP